MKLFLAALLLLLCQTAAAQQQLKFEPDTVLAIYNDCDMDTTFRVHLHNPGSTEVAFSGLLLTDTSKWSILQVEQGNPDLPFTIAAQDSVWIELRHEGSESDGNFEHAASLVALHASNGDTLVLNASKPFPSFYFSLPQQVITLDLGEIPLGDSVRHTIGVNWYADEYTRTIAKATPFDPSWSVEGIDSAGINDIQPIDILFRADRLGVHEDSIQFSLLCSHRNLQVKATVVRQDVKWPSDSVVDLLNTCTRPSNFIVAYTNRGDSDVRIDSIFPLGAPGAQWKIETPLSQNFVLAPKASGTIAIEYTPREAASGSLRLVVTGDFGRPDTVVVASLQRVPFPQFQSEGDTVRLTVRPGASISFVIPIKNNQHTPYRINSLSTVGSGLWTIKAIDTTAAFSLADRFEVEAQFAGTMDTGYYPMTFTVRGVPCDTPLTKTIIAHVTGDPLDVAELIKHPALIYPNPATTALTISYSTPFSYELFDVRGALVRTGKSSHFSSSVDVRDLPRGAYTLMVDNGSQRHIQLIMLR